MIFRTSWYFIKVLKLYLGARFITWVNIFLSLAVVLHKLFDVSLLTSLFPQNPGSACELSKQGRLYWEAPRIRTCKWFHYNIISLCSENEEAECSAKKEVHNVATSCGFQFQRLERGIWCMKYIEVKSLQGKFLLREQIQRSS